MKRQEDLIPSSGGNDNLVLIESKIKNWKFNKFLYSYVGDKWEWFDKAAWKEAEWKQYAEADNLRTFVAYVEGTPAGYFELQKQNMDNIQIMYFGLEPGFIGKGFGGKLLTMAITEAWNWGAARIKVNTCDLDHPSALINYQKRGFKLYHTKENA